ncbi:hypothetical protein FVEG_15443 [Fusarium verticillioides 7600]|uniref:Uncharacterized protein n=1 Tax=Gibberella moniliformis (strain M3125 / FGSC 7600) TaxID=334819 RepID=W7LVC7_GIBM7|nr:hypothetical protein FVEG_15443 [Fusarium verticillioides 7600]EWG42516.1 hypothetical protein FVEG_15443 [Fusarium verticillioides 7600]
MIFFGPALRRQQIPDVPLLRSSSRAGKYRGRRSM